jgi:DNA-binding CsgD family transcriptional regulator
VLLDLVESAVRTGRRGAADAHVAEMRRRGVDRISPRLHMVTSGCAALAATLGPDPDIAVALFEDAVAAPDGQHWPFDHARIQLAYGEHLRHLGRPEAARRHLGDALADLRQLGATPWTSRASAALRAAGVQPTAAPRAAGSLTAREREVAELAAQGLTNRQIGEVLFLSPRSVGAVLYRVFPKLGTTSRAALGAALERAPAG